MIFSYELHLNIFKLNMLDVAGLPWMRAGHPRAAGFLSKSQLVSVQYTSGKTDLNRFRSVSSLVCRTVHQSVFGIKTVVGTSKWFSGMNYISVCCLIHYQAGSPSLAGTKPEFWYLNYDRGSAGPVEKGNNADKQNNLCEDSSDMLVAIA